MTKSLQKLCCGLIEQNMNNATSPFTLPDGAPELARRFATIMAGLGALVARRFLRMPHLVGFTLLLWSRLNRAVRRFHRALTGTAKFRTRGNRRATVRVRGVTLPSGHGWLVRELGWEAAGYMSQLEALLSEATTQAALADLPAAGRILRPICRMLGVSGAMTPKVLPVVATPLPDGPLRPLAGSIAAAERDWVAPVQGLKFSDA